MAAIIARREWNRLPAGLPLIDWNHPSAQGLYTCAVPVDGNRAQASSVHYLWDAVGANLAQTTSQTTSGMVDGVAGNAFHFGGNGADQCPLVQATILPLTDATVMCLYNKTDGTNRTSALFGVSGTTPRFHAHAPFSDGTIYFDFGGAGSGANRLTLAGQSFTRPAMWCYSTGARSMEIWKNAVLLASKAGPSRTASVSGTWGINYFQAGTAGDVIDVYFFAAWARQLEVSEISDLTQNPWQLFAPRRRRLTAKNGASLYAPHRFELAT